MNYRSLQQYSCSSGLSRFTLSTTRISQTTSELLEGLIDFSHNCKIQYWFCWSYTDKWISFELFLMKGGCAHQSTAKTSLKKLFSHLHCELVLKINTATSSTSENTDNYLWVWRLLSGAGCQPQRMKFPLSRVKFLFHQSLIPRFFKIY